MIYTQQWRLFSLKNKIHTTAVVYTVRTITLAVTVTSWFHHHFQQQKLRLAARPMRVTASAAAASTNLMSFRTELQEEGNQQ